jgi:NADH:ubiquinone oxidoreductase subunit E
VTPTQTADKIVTEWLAEVDRNEDMGWDDIADLKARIAKDITEAVTAERSFLQDILIVAQMNHGFLPGQQIRSIKDWLEQPA